MRNSKQIKQFFVMLLAFSLTAGFCPGTAIAADDTDQIDAFHESTEAAPEESADDEVVTGSWTDYAAEAFHDGAYDEKTHTLTIDSAEELALFAKCVNEGISIFGYKADQEIMYSGMTVLLSRDIDLSAHDWIPIGTELHGLGADFDGNHKTITGLTVETEEDNAGLIGCMRSDKSSANPPRIENLVIDGASVKGGKNAGSLLGCGDAEISNVTVRNSSVEGTSFVGGIVGTSTGYIRSCSVENTSMTANDMEGILGGIVGLLDHAGVTECTVTGGSITGATDLGGIAGRIATKEDEQESDLNSEEATEETSQSDKVVESEPDAAIENASSEPAEEEQTLEEPESATQEDAESVESALETPDVSEEVESTEPIDETSDLMESEEILPEGNSSDADVLGDVEAASGEEAEQVSAESPGATADSEPEFSEEASLTEEITDNSKDTKVYAVSNNTVSGVLFSVIPAAELGTEPEYIGFVAGRWDEKEDPSAQTHLILENNNYADNLSPDDIVYVAAIGEEQYTSVADAVKAAEGQTVTLLSDVSLSQYIEIADSQNVTINLNSFAVTPSEDIEGNLPDALFVVHNGAALCIEDTSKSGTGKISYKATDGAEMPEGSTLVKVGLQEDESSKAAVLAVNNGTLEGKENAISCEGSIANITIHDGTLSGDSAAVVFHSGRLNITGGTFTVDTSRKEAGMGETTSLPCSAVCVAPGDEPAAVNITGGSFCGYYAFYESATVEQPNLSLNISGGVFTGVYCDALYVRDADRFITGGKYKTDPSVYLAKGYEVIKQE